jgi:hypothetical protein
MQRSNTTATRFPAVALWVRGSQCDSWLSVARDLRLLAAFALRVQAASVRVCDIASTRDPADGTCVGCEFIRAENALSTKEAQNIPVLIMRANETPSMRSETMDESSKVLMEQ